MSETAYSIRKCDHVDLDVLTKTRLEFLKEAGHIKENEDISALYNEIHEYINLHLNKDLHFWLVEIENEAIAAGAVSIWDKLPIGAGKDSRSKIGYFSNMYTHPAYRKRGIASCIMQYIFRFLKEEGIHKAMLHALEDGKGMYKKFGFGTSESFMEMKL